MGNNRILEFPFCISSIKSQNSPQRSKTLLVHFGPSSISESENFQLSQFFTLKVWIGITLRTELKCSSKDSGGGSAARGDPVSHGQPRLRTHSRGLSAAYSPRSPSMYLVMSQRHLLSFAHAFFLVDGGVCCLAFATSEIYIHLLPDTWSRSLFFLSPIEELISSTPWPERADYSVEKNKINKTWRRLHRHSHAVSSSTGAPTA